MVVGEDKEYLSVLLTLQTISPTNGNRKEDGGASGNNAKQKEEINLKAELTEETKRWFRHAR